MTSTTDTATIRLSTTRGLVAAIAPVLGFEPADSLVLVCLAGPRHRMGPVARVDLDAAPTSEALASLIECAERHADDVAVVAFHEGPRPACIDDLLAGLHRCHIPVVAVLSVAGGMIRDSWTAALFRADAGVRLPAPDDDDVVTLRAATALAGRTVLPSRAALVASIHPPPGYDEAAVSVLVASTLAGHTACPRSDHTEEVDTAGVIFVQEHLDLVCDQVRATGGVTDAVAAPVIAACQAKGGRDLVIASLAAADGATAIPALVAIVARCPDPYCAGPAAALAVVAYRFGDGALAHVAIDRVRSVEPANRLVSLLQQLIDAGVPPSSIVAGASAPHGRRRRRPPAQRRKG